jgi:hypothetical protein
VWLLRLLLPPQLLLLLLLHLHCSQRNKTAIGIYASAQ